MTTAQVKNWLLLRPLSRLTIRTQLLLFVASLVALVLLAQALYLHNRMAEAFSEQIGLRGLGVAQTVAQIPEIVAAFDDADPAATIQPLAESIRETVGSRYVVVGDLDGVRYAHPLEERLGLRMVGGDNDRALIHGESYVSQATGSLGEAIRGKTPIFDDAGEIIGVVSVGFMMETIEYDVAQYLRAHWILVALAVLVGLFGSLLIAHHFKRAIFGLEPHQIARLLMEKEAILQSIHEGMVAVNKEGRITLLNQTARQVLGLGENDSVLDRPIREVIPNSRLAEVLDSGKAYLDQEILINRHPYVVNRLPIKRDGIVDGAVATFRDQREIMELSEALNEASADVDALREQAHEFSNRLYTISGLLQLGQHKSALNLIQKENALAQEQVAYVMAHVSDPVVSGMLLSKMMRASQQGIELEVMEECSLQQPLTEAGQEALVTVVGNLLDNAFDAVSQQPGKSHVRLFFTDLGKQVLFEVEDNGCGVDPALVEAIAEKGFSTKAGRHRGFGLALVKQLCAQHDGQVYMEEGDLGGACFIVTLSKATLCKQPGTVL